MIGLSREDNLDMVQAILTMNRRSGSVVLPLFGAVGKLGNFLPVSSGLPRQP